MSPKVVVIANQKGGVGKTTTAITIGHGCAMRGYKCLIIDLDPQGHVAFSLGLQKQPDLYRLIVDNEPLSAVITNARENLDVILSDKRTEVVKRHIAAQDFREQVLTNTVENAPYDLVFLDSAPSIDVLHISSLVASDFVLIPTKLDALAVDGVNEMLSSIAQVIQHTARKINYTILPTFFDRTTKETMVQLEELVSTFPDNVWPPIPTDTKAREAAAYGQTIWEYTPKTSAVLGYKQGEDRVGGYEYMLERFIAEIIHG